MNVEHNYNLSTKPKIIIVHRRDEINENMLIAIAKTSNSLQISKQIHINIQKTNRRSDITIQNVYNAKKKIKHRRLNKHTLTQTLLKILNKNCWFVKFQLNLKTKRIKRLFFVNKNIKKILFKNSKMLIMNCTYKINKYRMSLFIIINVIALKTSFYIAKVFLNSETFDNFN